MLHRLPRHHRPALAIVALLTVALLATTFGSAAEGKRPSHDASAVADWVADDPGQDEWCANRVNAGALAAAARRLGQDTADDEWLTVLDAAAAPSTSGYEARSVGSQYAALRHDWDDWDRVCRRAYLASG